MYLSTELQSHRHFWCENWFLYLAADLGPVLVDTCFQWGAKDTLKRLFSLTMIQIWPFLCQRPYMMFFPMDYSTRYKLVSYLNLTPRATDHIPAQLFPSASRQTSRRASLEDRLWRRILRQRRRRRLLTPLSTLRRHARRHRLEVGDGLRRREEADVAIVVAGACWTI